MSDIAINTTAEKIETMANMIIDDYPVEDSENLVKSGGVFGALRREPKLINTITLTDDTTNTVEFTLDSNSNAFLLKNHIMIRMQVPQAESDGWVMVRLQDSNTVFIGNALMTTSGGCVSKCELNWNGYDWTGLNILSRGPGVNGIVYSPSYYNTFNKEIRKVALVTQSSTIFFPNGTVIKVYGENYA